MLRLPIINIRQRRQNPGQKEFRFKIVLCPSKNLFYRFEIPSSLATGSGRILPSKKMLPTGLTMAAVPVPNISRRLPSLAPSRTSVRVSFPSRISTSSQSLASSITDRRVTPGRIIPLSREGVINLILPEDLSLKEAKMFIAPTSVISMSGPNSHNT